MFFLSEADQARLAELFSVSPVAMYVIDDTASVRMANDAAVALFGYPRDELIGLSIDALHHPMAGDDAPAPQGTETFRRRDGSTIEVEIDSRAIQHGGRPAHLVVAHDVTRRRLVGAAEREVYKMQALTRFSGSVVHDVNNLLSVILSYADFLISDLGPQHPSTGDAEEVKRTGRRAAELMQRLMSFSKIGSTNASRVDLHAQIERGSVKLAAVAGEVAIQLKCNATRKYIVADPAAVDAVLVSLVQNAREASAPGSKIVIETLDGDVDIPSADLHAFAQHGEHVILRVSDRGRGIERSVLEHVFEPFFSTKPRGKGIGLGLPLVFGFTTGLHGHVRITTEPGVGTTVALWIPATSA
ncbi:N/A [soil metagenome]